MQYHVAYKPFVPVYLLVNVDVTRTIKSNRLQLIPFIGKNYLLNYMILLIQSPNSQFETCTDHRILLVLVRYNTVRSYFILQTHNFRQNTIFAKSE